jgi:hypothetical protein
MAEDLSAEDQAMMLFQMFQQAMGEGEEEEEEDERVQCPICNKYHEPTENHDATNKAEACSHGGLVVYIAHQCPICLEDPAGPPMVAMPCGHLVCTTDFQELGGYLGEKPNDEDRPHRRRARERNEERRMDPNRFMEQLNMFRMMGMPPFGFGTPPGFDADDQDDEDEEDADDDDDDDSQGSCPPLERVGGDGDDSDAGSMPPLEPVRRDNAAGEDDSDDDSMPPLAARNDDSSDDDDDDDSIPPLLPRNDSDEDSDDEESLPPLMPRGRRGQADSDSEDEDNDDDDLPPLLAGNGDSSSDEDSTGSCPPLERVDVDSDDDDSSMPPALDVGSDSDESMPDLNRMDGRRVQDDDDDSIPRLQRRNQGRNAARRTPMNSSDSESEEEPQEEEEEEEEEIPYPDLERIAPRGARAPTVLTIEEYRDLPEAQRNVGPGGAWLLLPSDEHDDYSTLLYTTMETAIHIGVFHRESRLIVNDEDGILVCAPKKGKSSESVVYNVNLERTERICEIPTNAQITADGEGGVWTLTPSGNAKELSFYDADTPTGSVMDVLPEACYIIQDPLGAVWIHARKKGSTEMEPGLYYYAGRGQLTMMKSIEQDAKCSPGAEGVCIATNVDGKVQLNIVDLGPEQLSNILPCSGSSRDVRVVSREIDSGMYVHCRKDNRWKLCLLDNSRQFNDICDCPKDARVVGNGKGGAWILKRTGASHQMRMLVSVSETGVVRDHGLAFPPGSKICGL